MPDLHQLHRYLHFFIISKTGKMFSLFALFSFRKQTKPLFPTPRRLPCHPSNMYTACIYPVRWMQSYRPDGDSEGM